MNYLKTIRQACILIMLLSTLVGAPAAAATPTHPSSCTGTWTIVPSPNGNSTLSPNSALNAVTAVSANDIWSVGWDGESALIEHWNGTKWSVVPSPNTLGGALLGITTLSATNIWAVGSYINGRMYLTLIEHWDGISWHIVPSPNVLSSDNYLVGVAALSATDIWAVGAYSNDSQTLTEHWNGTTWSIVPSPNPGSNIIRLNGVTVVSSQDVWAVGYYTVNKNNYALTEHWDGHRWRIIPDHIGYSALWAVTTLNPNNIWAVGNGNGALIERWNGRHWHVVQNGPYNFLTSVTAWASNNIWAVGTTARLTFTEHWNGTTWQQVPSPSIKEANGAPIYNYLFGVAMTSAHSVWAVGYANNLTLIEHYC